MFTSGNSLLANMISKHVFPHAPSPITTNFLAIVVMLEDARNRFQVVTHDSKNVVHDPTRWQLARVAKWQTNRFARITACMCPRQVFFSEGTNGGRVFDFLTCVQMPGVTVKDVSAEKFVPAFAEFLKRTGKVSYWSCKKYQSAFLVVSHLSR
jgi:hypothetical protein